MIKIALVDDHILLRKSLGILIGMLQDFEIVMEADNGQHFIEQLKTHAQPDIVLMDVTMPLMDGMATTRWLTNFHPEIKVLALSMIKNEPMVLRMIKNGARGYLLKDCEPAELKTALWEVYSNGYYYNELLTRKMKIKKLDPGKVALTEQEYIFMRWTCTELTHKQIAEEMKLSPRTLDGYRDSLFAKLEVNSRVGIAIYAIKNGLVQI